jgi:ATP-dependent Zn protease
VGEAKRKKVATAWHEAGHIVVGLHFGFRLVQATITPRHAGDSGTFWGTTEWAPIGGTLNVLPIVCMALAGGIAEERWGGISSRHVHADDLANISVLAWLHLAKTDTFTPNASLIPKLTSVYRHHPERVPERVKRIADEMIVEAIPEATRIVNEQWSQVGQVAGLLLKHTVVTPELISSQRK